MDAVTRLWKENMIYFLISVLTGESKVMFDMYRCIWVDSRYTNVVC